MRVVAEEAWGWLLVEHEGSLMLGVLCGSIGLYTVGFCLSPSERAAYDAQGEAFLRELAREVSRQPERFRSRQMDDFEGLPGMREATAAWQRARAATR